MIRARWWAPAALVLAGCGGGGAPPVSIVESAVTAGVSSDQSLLAYFTQPSLLTVGEMSGALNVMPLPSGAGTALGEAAFNVGFGASDGTLYFHTGPAKDMTTGAFDGRAWVWTPALAGPVALSSGYTTLGAATRDNAVHLFVDVPVPDQSAPGNVELVDTRGCAGTSCPVRTLASGVVVTATRLSPDGRWAAYDTKTAGGSVDTYDFFLVPVAGGAPSHVASTTIPAQLGGHFSAFSPDCSLLATLATNGADPMQLQVVSTATGQPVPWAAPPAGMPCTDLVFTDSGTILVGVQGAGGATTYHRTTAVADATFVSATQIFLPRPSSGVVRSLFFSTTPAAELAQGSLYDLQLIDLSTPGAAAVPLAAATRTQPRISDDGSTAWFLDHYDPTTQMGTLVEASLPDGRLTTVGSSIGAFTANFGGGTSHLFFSPNEPTPSAVPNASGLPLDVFSEGAVQKIDPDTLHWDTAIGPATLYVTADNPLRIYRVPLP